MQSTQKAEAEAEAEERRLHPRFTAPVRALVAIFGDCPRLRRRCSGAVCVSAS